MDKSDKSDVDVTLCDRISSGQSVTLSIDYRERTPLDTCEACGNAGYLWLNCLKRLAPCPACEGRSADTGLARPDAPWVSVVFDHYGLTCACCGTPDNLTIDHVHGGGTEHIKTLGMRFHTWLIVNDFPAGFQTLCLSCNSSKGQGERCRQPHPEKLRKALNGG